MFCLKKQFIANMTLLFFFFFLHRNRFDNQVWCCIDSYIQSCPKVNQMKLTKWTHPGIPVRLLFPGKNLTTSKIFYSLFSSGS